MTSNFDHARELVYAQDRDRFFASLFAPEKERQALLALFAFNIEIARVRDLVREPLPGEVRLQWWRDFLNGVEHGDASANPIAAALGETIKIYELPVKPLTDMIDARIFDLYNDPMPSLNDLEGYCGETVSALFQMSCLILNKSHPAATDDHKTPETADLSGHAGVAYGLTGLLRAFPWHAARGQLYMPQDVFQRHGVDTLSVLKGKRSDALSNALNEMHEHVHHHMGRVEKAIQAVQEHLLPAFLPLALIGPRLRRMKKPSYDPFAAQPDLSQLKRQWLLWRASKNPLRIARL
ncbi:MAG: squalene/phytoene synthase family protein [Rhodobacteraceae bacterium]|nr:squalene/phytoene synthase family protein [Paracoccaceae bacterium]